jgi:hypothetical protein
VENPYLNSVLEAIASDALDPEGPHLITADELRAAGALDVPAAWRKSLSAGRDLSLGLFADESAHSEEQEPTPRGRNGDVSEDQSL